MHQRHHPLNGSALGTQRQIVSFHYGPQGTGRKAYLQASLHADELPGMLVAHHLRQRLQSLETHGRLRGEVVVVPVANPIGLGQTLMFTHIGRFEMPSGENFNRHYPALLEPLKQMLQGQLGGEASANALTVRAAMRSLVAALPDSTELMSQRKVLLTLACDAEVVIDLHCDAEALLHLYTGNAIWPQAEPLARYTGARVSLLAAESGDNPFDEACSQTWWQLEEHFRGRHPIPFGCMSATLELRGAAEVTHSLAAADAEALIAFLTHRGIVDSEAPPMPPLRNDPTPLSGAEMIKAPVSGIVVYLRELGDRIRPGDVVAEVIDPIGGVVHAVKCSIDGLLFAREFQRFTRAGRTLCKVAGAVPLRSGKLSTE
jgi:predicted deacylase